MKPAVEACPGELEPILIEPVQTFLLQNVGWQDYLAIGNALAERGNLRLTYDEGSLEFMSLSELHELIKCLLSHLINILLEEFDLPGNPYGQMTQRRQDLAKGLEPDACYYLKNWERVRDLERIDLGRDPPPDLALEIDVTNSSIERMPLYEKLGIPELWRVESQVLHVYVLDATGHYQRVERSPTFPTIPIEEFMLFVRQGIKDGTTAMTRSFRPWVRQRIAAANGN